MALILGIVSTTIFYGILYYTIKAAVRNGIIEARHMSDLHAPAAPADSSDEWHRS